MQCRTAEINFYLVVGVLAPVIDILWLLILTYHELGIRFCSALICSFVLWQLAAMSKGIIRGSSHGKKNSEKVWDPQQNSHNKSTYVHRCVIIIISGCDSVEGRMGLRPQIHLYLPFMLSESFSLSHLLKIPLLAAHSQRLHMFNCQIGAIPHNSCR